MKTTTLRWLALCLIACMMNVSAFAQVEFVHDLIAGGESSRPSDLTQFQGELYFTATDGEHGREIWKTDGTLATRVTDVNPEDGNYVRIIGATSDHVYFHTSDSTYATDGAEVWTLGPIEPKLYSIVRGAPVKALMGHAILMKAYEPEHGTEPWVLENGEARLLADLNPGSAGSGPDDFRLVDDAVYFLACGEDCVQEGRIWWRTDGFTVERVQGTPGEEADMIGISGYDGKLYFSAVTPEHGREVWVAEGLEAHLEADLYPGPEGSWRWYGGAEVFGGELFFFNWSNLDLWSTDGESFTLTGAIEPGPSDPYSPSIGFMGQTRDALIAAHCAWNVDGSGHCQVLRGNGYEFTEIGEIDTPDEGVWGLYTAGGRYFFSADSEGAGIELWELGGGGIYLVEDLYPGPFHGLRSVPVPVGGKLYFAGDDGVHGVELWALDVTGTDSESVETVSEFFALRSVYPNPARDAATAHYTLDAPQAVTLELIDLLGRRVRSAELGPQAAGAHDVRVDMRGLRPGLYVLRLRGDAGAEATRQVVVMR